MPPVPASLRQRWARLGIPADYVARRGLPLQREARVLTVIGRDSAGRAVKLAPAAAAAWHRLQAAAAGDGIELVPLSGFRSVARQAAVIRRHVAAGRPIAAILRYVAAPGCSEHHTGRAIDLGTPGSQALEESFARTAAYRWLAKNAGRFGFRLSYPRRNRHGIGYEPWHWFWRGRLKA